jgi:hypothetical protein
MRNGECWEQQTLAQTIRGTESGLSPNGVDRFHTPNTTGLDGGSNSRRALRKKTENWPTPRSCSAMAATITPESAWNENRNPNLETIVGRRTWPTPVTRDYKDTGTQESMTRQLNKRESPGLALMVGAATGGKLNPTWVEKLMGWPADWTCIDNISHTKMIFWIMGFYDDKERCTNQILQMLRQGNVSKEIQQQIGRPVCILETSVLLTQLCEYSNRPNEAWVFFSCQKILEDEMRGLWSQQETSSSSHRSEYQEQFGKQHSDTMQALSRLLAYDGKEAWKNNSWEDAIPRVGKNIIARVDRLKVIGNGQVPLCAATAWRILK